VANVALLQLAPEGSQRRTFSGIGTTKAVVDLAKRRLPMANDVHPCADIAIGLARRALTVERSDKARRESGAADDDVAP
jgi:hypothetical protein